MFILIIIVLFSILLYVVLRIIRIVCSITMPLEITPESKLLLDSFNQVIIFEPEGFTSRQWSHLIKSILVNNDQNTLYLFASGSSIVLHDFLTSSPSTLTNHNNLNCARFMTVFPNITMKQLYTSDDSITFEKVPLNMAVIIVKEQQIMLANKKTTPLLELNQVSRWSSAYVGLNSKKGYIIDGAVGIQTIMQYRQIKDVITSKSIRNNK